MGRRFVVVVSLREASLGLWGGGRRRRVRNRRSRAIPSLRGGRARCRRCWWRLRRGCGLGPLWPCFGG